MNAKKLRQLRHRAYVEQDYCCYYCQYPIWSAESKLFSIVHDLPSRLVRHLQCTAEHLKALQDGGRDTPENIVATCLWCNRMRHCGRQHSAPDAATYKARVGRLIAIGRWHPITTSKRMKQFDSLG
jgi:hypothetical protein